MRIIISRFLLAALTSILMAASPALAESPTSRNECQASPLLDGTILISSYDKSLIASQIYYLVKSYFGNWAGLPDDYDFDQHYQDFLQKIIPIHSRWAFDKEALKLFASLKNGHTGFYDDYLSCIPPLPFEAEYSPEKQWVITYSSLPDLAVGSILTKINGEAFDHWAKEQSLYLPEPNKKERQTRLFYRSWLWPQDFSLTLQDGKTIQIKRDFSHEIKESVKPFKASEIRPGFYVLTLPTFDDPAIERDALAFLKTHQERIKTLLLDLRGNDGGMTPTDLQLALRTHAFHTILASTPQHIAVNEAYAHFGFQWAFPDTTLHFGGNLERPQNPLYTGPLYVLADHHCLSACEDFLLEIKLGKRGPILGETSFGSSSDSFLQNLPAQHMTLRIGTTRSYYPDGSPFEGVGVAPDIPLHAKLSEKDSLLKQAVSFISNHPKPNAKKEKNPLP